MSSRPMLQDVVPPEHRSVRRIAVSDNPKFRRNSRPENEDSDMPPPRGTEEYETPERPRFGIWIIAAIALVGLSAALMYFFAGATVNVTLRQEEKPIDLNVTAFRKAEDGQLSYTVATLSKEDSSKIPATSESSVSEKASGQIVIYNNYSSAPQVLIAKTRFETKEGLIYRIDKSVTVPGKKIENGVNVPGNSTVTVYSDKAGEAYNVGLTDFTIPGFKGDPRFDGFYARSKTAMTGGFIGMKKIVSPDAIKNARAALVEKLTADLAKDVGAQLPSGYLFLQKSYSLEFTDLPSVSLSDALEVRLRGTIQAYIFESSALSDVLTKKIFPEDTGPIDITNLDTLSVTVNKFDASPNGRLDFSIRGSARAVWRLDTDVLRRKLSGINKKNASAIFASHPEIQKATVTVRPFWQKSFPADSYKIKIRLGMSEE